MVFRILNRPCMPGDGMIRMFFMVVHIMRVLVHAAKLDKNRCTSYADITKPRETMFARPQCHMYISDAYPNLDILRS